ncbi:MAG TPA: hypothetical protein DCY13_08495 [Verrucomicrobiales bacterium]|nr:hypothetical protein [Verrucomicrobiales bacterium]
MLQLHYLEDLDLPELEPYRTLRRRKDMARMERFVAEGDKVVQRLLHSRFAYTIESLLITPEWLLRLRPELECRPEEIRAFITDPKSIEEISGFTVYHGVKLTARLGTRHTLEDVMERTPSPRLFVACDGLANAENMGAIIRNTAAFGGHAILIGETSSSPYLTRAIRASMGTVFDLPTVCSDCLVDTLKDLKWRGVRVIGAHAHAKQGSLAAADLSGDLCMVFGSEGHGLSDAVAEVCDELIIIPMAGEVDSLNVGSAAAVFLYEAARQRGGM